MSAFIEKFN